MTFTSASTFQGSWGIQERYFCILLLSRSSALKRLEIFLLWIIRRLCKSAIRIPLWRRIVWSQLLELSWRMIAAVYSGWSFEQRSKIGLSYGGSWVEGQMLFAVDNFAQVLLTSPVFKLQTLESGWWRASVASWLCVDFRETAVRWSFGRRVDF